MFRLKLYNKKITGYKIKACLIQNSKIELWEIEGDGVMKFIKMYDDLNELAKEWSGEE